MDDLAVEEPKVEIIILTHNGKKHIERCLNSLKKTRYSNLIVSVVEQNSSDGSAEYIREKHAWVNLILNNENKGFAEGNNEVLRNSKAKYCILLNNDTEQELSWIRELVKVAEKRKDVGALQPKILSMNDRKRFEYAGAGGGFIDMYGYPVCRGRIFDSVEKDEGQYDDLIETFWSCGVAMFLNMEAIRKVGYLDETFGSYGEELDFCWRLNLAGYKVVFVPDSVIYHLGSASWGKKECNFKKEYLHQRNHWIPLFKNYSMKNWFRILPIKLFLEFITAFGFMFSNPRKSLASVMANFWVAGNFGFLVRKNRRVALLRKIPDEKIMRKMIKTSVALHYFLSGSRKNFGDYQGFIEDYEKLKL